MRKPKGDLVAWWGKLEGESPDVCFHWDKHKSDGHLLYMFFNQHQVDYNGDLKKSFMEELESRGYDITTLKFSIQRKKDVVIGS